MRCRAILSAAAAGLLCTGAPARARGGVACPRAVAGRAAAGYEVGTLYYGALADGARQAPDRSIGAARGSFVNRWYLPQGGDGYTLVCHYAGGHDLPLRLPAGVRGCRQTSAAFTCR